MCQKIVLPVVGIPLFAYGFMILLGFLLGSFLVQREAPRRGLPKEKILDFAMFLVLAGVVGARVFFIVQFYDDHFRGKPWYEFLAIWRGGLVFYGGVLAALPVGWWYLRRHKLPVLRTLDTCAPFVPIGMAFGRIGCWLNGCCWGVRCGRGLPALLTRFPPGSPAHGHQFDLGLIGEAERTLSVHPVQLYDSLHSFVLFGLLWWYLRRDPPAGAVTCLYVALYGVGRFFLEFIRGDHRLTVTGLTVGQDLSILMVLAGIAGLIAVSVRIR